MFDFNIILNRHPCLFPMVSLESFIEIVLPGMKFLWGRINI